MLIAFGVAIAAIALLVLFYYKDARAFRIDLDVALVLIVFGALMRIGSRRVS